MKTCANTNADVRIHASRPSDQASFTAKKESCGHLQPLEDVSRTLRRAAWEAETWKKQIFWRHTRDGGESDRPSVRPPGRAGLIHVQKRILRPPPTSRRRLQDTAKSSLGNRSQEKAYFLAVYPRANAQSVARERPLNPPKALPSTPNTFDSITKR